MSHSRRIGLRDAVLAAGLAAAFLLFASLGTWQVKRLFWKLDLIDRVETQLAQPPVPAPGPDRWPEVGRAYAYLPVKVRGNFLHDRETHVQAMTSHGSGYWVMTPMLTTRGFFVLINRGFVDPAHRGRESRRESENEGTVEVSGLLRLTEPEGRFMAPNRPEEDRWYARDVGAIGARRQVPAEATAPYFIDADATSNPGGWPIGGLTVVRFRNAHLGYAITWYALALLTVVGAWLAWRERGNGMPPDGPPVKAGEAGKAGPGGNP